MQEGLIVLPVHAVEACVRRGGPAPIMLNFGAGYR